MQTLKEVKTNRREFIKKAGLVTACTCIGVSAFSGCSMFKGVSDVPAATADMYALDNGCLMVFLDKATLLEKPGSAVKFSFMPENEDKAVKLILIHTPDEGFIAFSDSCTHGGRELNYKPDMQTLECSSFGHSKFNLEGAVLGGPAKDPLVVYQVEKTGNNLEIIL